MATTEPWYENELAYGLSISSNTTRLTTAEEEIRQKNFVGDEDITHLQVITSGWTQCSKPGKLQYVLVEWAEMRPGSDRIVRGFTGSDPVYICTPGVAEIHCQSILHAKDLKRYSTDRFKAVMYTGTRMMPEIIENDAPPRRDHGSARFRFSRIWAYRIQTDGRTLLAMA